ncbi:hypothetical protein J7E70_07780 [Variovorax paradoxus]|nr:hypothetical protein [Variovorax paradoxus]MBT2300362.1 hypothetical protein [Variovorax paradoxus]
MADYSNPFFGQANPFLGRDNPYLTDKINQAQGDLVRNYNLTTQPAYNNAQVKSGSFGNQGVQQMNENAQLNLQKSLGDVSTNMRGADYRDQQNLYMQDRAQNIGNYQWDQGFNRQLFNDSYSQNMNNLATGMGLLGSMNGYNAQDLQNGTTIQNTPLNYWSQFSNQANGMGQGYGTQTGTASGGGSNPLVSGLGGAQLGAQAMNWWNNYNSGSTLNNNAQANGYGNTFQQNGYSPDVSYG